MYIYNKNGLMYGGNEPGWIDHRMSS